jgi:CRP-like cAMP-binding protein
MKNNNKGTWVPGETVYNCGDPPDSAFLIISGKVEFFSKNNIYLGDAGQSEVFGEISCYLNRSHSVTAKAKTHLVTKNIPKIEFTKIIKNAHPVIMGMLRSTYHRLSDANVKREFSEEEIKKYSMMFDNSVQSSEDIKNKIDTIKQKLDKNMDNNEESNQ